MSVKEYTPQVKVVTVKGRLLQLVNWQDYKGWEVRLEQQTLGFVHEHELGPIRKWGAERQRPDLRELHNPTVWDTLDEALAYLVGRSK